MLPHIAYQRIRIRLLAQLRQMYAVGYQEILAVVLLAHGAHIDQVHAFFRRDLAVTAL